MKGNTQELAKKAADELLKEGVRPTQQNVRARMGSGSITTINKALNAWWSELGERMKANTQHPMIPDPVAESASKLWVQALAYAEKHLEERRVELERKYQKLERERSEGAAGEQKEVKELRSQCLRLLQDLERVQSEKHDLQHRVAKDESKIMSMQSEIDSLGREVRQMEALGNQVGVDEYIELQVNCRTLKEENKRLNKQVDMLISEKSALMLEIARLEQDNHAS